MQQKNVSKNIKIHHEEEGRKKRVEKKREREEIKVKNK